MAEPNTNRPAPPILQPYAPEVLNLAGWSVYDWIYDPAQGPLSSSHGLPIIDINQAGPTPVLQLTGRGVVMFALFGIENTTGQTKNWQGELNIDGNFITQVDYDVPANQINRGFCFVGAFMLSSFEVNLAGYHPGYLPFESSVTFEVTQGGGNGELLTRFVYDIART